jgi:D-threo-aldose 1-dehydrogenase
MLGRGGDATTQRRYQETLENAYVAGFRYYDTAELYGGSEFRVGKFLRTVPRNSVFVATKSRIPPQLTPEEAAIHVRQSLHNSLERLGVSTLDLFQIHDISTLEQVLASGGVLEVLLKAKSEGLIRYIGLATRWHDLSEIAADTPGFDTVLTYLDYNLIDQSADFLIAHAAARGIGVINATPLANGLLVGTDPRHSTETHPEVRRYRLRAIRLYDFAVSHGIPLLALALQFPNQNPGVSITLTGPADPDQLRSTIDACTVEIPPQVWEELHQLLHPAPVRS